VTYSSPYLLNAPYANLGAKVGFIWGGLCIFFLLFSIFFVPELKGRSLEETEEMFDTHLKAWQFKNYKTSGFGAMLAAHRAGHDTKEDRAVAAEAKHGHEIGSIRKSGEDLTDGRLRM
jgi:heme/copper-type cytochrome/quinol oxidase subunit 3